MLQVSQRAPRSQISKTFDRAFVPWAIVGLASVLVIYFQGQSTWLSNNQTLLQKPVTDGIRQVVSWIEATFGWVFSGISALLTGPLEVLQTVLHTLPWSVTLALFSWVAFVAGGRRLALFTALSLFYMVLTGYWQQSMSTLALVGIAAPLAGILGFAIGVLGYRSPRFRRAIEPSLDLMQTVPAFAYLVPLLVLFGFGPVAGLIASAIFATPPMVRNVMHGLCAVPPTLIESAIMSGATRRQCFWLVELPAARPQIMVGLNQTIMATLSMVIIAAVIGGFNDIGWEVLSTMRKAQFGQSLISGLVIALIAMILDRISCGFANRARRTRGDPAAGPLYLRLLGASAILLAIFLLGSAVPALQQWPGEWRVYPASEINATLDYVVQNYGWIFSAFKSAANFYFLLPIKIGFVRLLESAGAGWPLEYKVAFWAAVACLALLIQQAISWRFSVLLLIVTTVIFFGLADLPWAVTFMVVSLVAYQAGGVGVMTSCIIGMSFILLTGMWPAAMLSVYLSGAAVAFSFVVGGAIGMLAAKSDRLSAFVRPINDTLQTIPQFVYLIPVVFLFAVGDFSALVAVIAYSIVPMIRYTEHAFREVPPQIVEAGTALGCNTRQLRLQVELPVAWPTIMLGVNQTIMYALSMLVIAALVGTRDLGQSIYNALTRADTGAALTAGLSIAIIAMIADRIIQSWVRNSRVRLKPASRSGH